MYPRARNFGGHACILSWKNEIFTLWTSRRPLKCTYCLGWHQDGRIIDASECYKQSFSSKVRWNVFGSTNITNKWLCLLSVMVFLTTEVKTCSVSHSTDQAKYELGLAMFFLSNNFQAWNISSNQRNLVVMSFASLSLFERKAINGPLSRSHFHQTVFIFLI